MWFWLIVLAVIGVLFLLAWWVSGPRFIKRPNGAQPPSHQSPGLPRGTVNGGGGAGA